MVFDYHSKSIEVTGPVKRRRAVVYHRSVTVVPSPLNFAENEIQEKVSDRVVEDQQKSFSIIPLFSPPPESTSLPSSILQKSHLPFIIKKKKSVRFDLSHEEEDEKEKASESNIKFKSKVKLVQTALVKKKRRKLSVSI